MPTIGAQASDGRHSAPLRFKSTPERPLTNGNDIQNASRRGKTPSRTLSSGPLSAFQPDPTVWYAEGG